MDNRMWYSSHDEMLCRLREIVAEFGDDEFTQHANSVCVNSIFITAHARGSLETVLRKFYDGFEASEEIISTILKYEQNPRALAAVIRPIQQASFYQGNYSRPTTVAKVFADEKFYELTKDFSGLNTANYICYAGELVHDIGSAQTTLDIVLCAAEKYPEDELNKFMYCMKEIVYYKRSAELVAKVAKYYAPGDQELLFGYNYGIGGSYNPKKGAHKLAKKILKRANSDPERQKSKNPLLSVFSWFSRVFSGREKVQTH